MSPEGESTVPARVVLFGFEPVEVRVQVRARARAWRVAGAARSLGLGLLIAPLVAVVPPHAPWAIGALAVGAVFARRRWSETETLERIEGPCPKCGHPLHASPTRLVHPHPIECDHCHHVSSLELSPEGAPGS